MDQPTSTCFRCRYDLRATPADGACPECGMPAAESGRLHAEKAKRRFIWNTKSALAIAFTLTLLAQLFPSLDGGVTGNCLMATSLGFWITLILPLWRRSKNPTKVDLAWMTFGQLPMFGLCGVYLTCPWPPLIELPFIIPL